jgi:hypothetical protein
MRKLIFEPRNRRLFQRRDSAHQTGRSEAFERLRSWESGLVRIPSAFGPQNTGKRDSHPVRGVPAGSGGQSGETSQSRDFRVRGSQSFQGVRKRLKDLGTSIFAQFDTLQCPLDSRVSPEPADGAKCGQREIEPKLRKNCSGVANSAFEEVVSYSRDSNTFSRPLCGQQSVPKCSCGQG